jgi:hypothetical protein
VCTGRPSRRASRSWYGAVRTTAVARSRSSLGTESGSTTGARRRARSRTTKRARATAVPRSSRDAAIANARPQAAAHAWAHVFPRRFLGQTRARRHTHSATFPHTRADSLAYLGTSRRVRHDPFGSLFRQVISPASWSLFVCEVPLSSGGMALGQRAARGDDV